MLSPLSRLLCCSVALACLHSLAPAITITGYTAAASDRWTVNPTNPLTGPFTPNTHASFIGLNYDLSGVGWQSTNLSGYQDLSVTLISPMHFAAAKHVGFGYTNTAYTFQNTDGTLVSRTIGNTLNISDVGGVSADSRVVRLDAPFSSTDKVKVYRLLDTGAYSNLTGKNAILYGHANSAGSYQRRLGLGVISITSNNLIYTPQSASLTNYVTTLVSGDSGSPTFVVYNGELHLVGTHYANGGGYSQDNNFSYNYIYINTNAFLAADGFALRWTIDTTNARTWTGTTDGTFGTATNWLSLNQPSEFTSAAFDGAATSNRTISLGSAATVRGMLFKGAAGTNPFTFSGSTLTLLESGLRNEDTDTLTINNPITLGGSQNWEAQNGPITLGADIATAGFLVVLSGEQPITLTGNITGTGSVAWDNPGTFTPASGKLGFTTGKLFVRRGTVNLATANSYSGGTIVTGGTLLANNPGGSATGTGPVTLSNSARLGGNGTITGAVTLQNTSGLLANLTTTPGSHDKLDITGALTLGTTSTLTITADSSATTGTYTLVTASAGITGTLPTLTLPSGWSASVQISGNNLNLTVTSLVPTFPVLSAQSATGYLSTTFSYPIATTQTPATSFTITGGTLPAGVTLNTTTGVLSGTPTQAGIFNVTFTGTNAQGTSSPVTIPITIGTAVTSILYEPFSYTVGGSDPDPDGGLNSGNGLPATNNGGSPSGTSTGLRGNWGTTTDVVSGLTYAQAAGTLVTSGAAARINNATWGVTTPAVYRNMTTDPFLSQRIGGTSSGNFGVSGTSLFMSFLGQTSSATADAFRLSLRFDGSSNFFVSNTATGWSLNGTLATGAALALNTPTLFVIRFDFGASTTTINLWINPTLGQALGTPNAVVSGINFPGFQNFQTRAAVANAMTFDELRLGTTLASVTPFTAPPTAPSGLSATANSASQITLAWTDNSATETGFKVERSPNGSTGWTLLTTTAANATGYADTGLSAGTAYYYRVSATNGLDSTVTSTATATTQTGVQEFRSTLSLASDGSQDALTPAGDGIANLFKYAFNMLGNGTGQAVNLATPNAATLAPGGSAGLPLVGVESGTGKLQITYIRRIASTSPGVTYTVQFTNDVGIGDVWAVNGSATESVTPIDATWERVTTTDSVSSPAKRFARVKITSP